MWIPSSWRFLLSSRTWLAPVTLATRADEAGEPPLKVLRDLGQPPAAGGLPLQREFLDDRMKHVSHGADRRRRPVGEQQTLDPVAVITAVPNSAIGSHARGGGSGARARECGEARGPCSPALLNDQWPWLWLWPWLWPWPWPWPWLWPWPWPWFRTLCSNQLTHWPWFLNDGDVNELQPPCLHWSFEVGPPVTGTSGWPLKV